MSFDEKDLNLEGQEERSSKVNSKNRIQEGVILANLLKGPLYIEDDRLLFRALIEKQIEVESLAQKLGLTIFIDETEGYAFVRSMSEIPDDYGQLPPRLIARRPLSYQVTLLLVLLRQRLLEYDESEESLGRLVLSYEELLEMLKIYLPKTTNEATQLAKIEATIKKVVEMGFLRELDSDPSLKRYEVRRIIKALVQSDTLTQIKEKFKELLQDRA